MKYTAYGSEDQIRSLLNSLAHGNQLSHSKVLAKVNIGVKCMTRDNVPDVVTTTYFVNTGCVTAQGLATYVDKCYRVLNGVDML